MQLLHHAEGRQEWVPALETPTQRALWQGEVSSTCGNGASGQSRAASTARRGAGMWQARLSHAGHWPHKHMRVWQCASHVRASNMSMGVNASQSKSMHMRAARTGGVGAAGMPAGPGCSHPFGLQCMHGQAASSASSGVSGMCLLAKRRAAASNLSHEGGQQCEPVAQHNWRHDGIVLLIPYAETLTTMSSTNRLAWQHMQVCNHVARANLRLQAAGLPLPPPCLLGGQCSVSLAGRMCVDVQRASKSFDPAHQDDKQQDTGAGNKRNKACQTSGGCACMHVLHSP